MSFCADFETLVSEQETRVWAWAVKDIDSERFVYGNSMGSFIQFCKLNPDTYYFHNLKFDGEFIISWLLNNGYSYSHKRRLKSKQFTAIIADTGQWYSLTLCINTKVKIKFLDSLKILPLSVAQIAKAFSLPMEKLKIDYLADRPINHELTQEEIAYIHNDVSIVAGALQQMFAQGLTSMTQASNAMQDYKGSIGAKYYKHWFPVFSLELDADMRQCYKGGFTYLNPKYKEKDIGAGIVLDVNSLYPSVMYNELLPYAIPRKFEGKYIPNDDFPLYIQYFSCYFELKPGHIPTLQMKHSAFFKQNEYIVSSKGRDYNLCMTNVDLELFLAHYDVYGVEWQYGYMFMGAKGMFKSYIDKWTEIKINADMEGNNGLRQIAKLQLNSLYGRFGLNPNCTRKMPFLSESGIVKYATGEAETRNPVYLPMAAFITAYARYKTITSAQMVYDRFVYADTDSLHLLGTELPNLEIHDTKLGAWKHESTFDKARFIRQKCYIEHWIMHKNKQTDTNNITCAGLPKNCIYACKIYKLKKFKNLKAVNYKKIDFSNFHTGMKSFGKLVPKHVVGGIVLFGTDFTIK